MNVDIKIKTIAPILWLGPGVFQITATDDLRVLVRRGNHGWYACSSAEEAFDGGAKVAGCDADLLEASAKALALARAPDDLFELERERTAARSSAAAQWKYYIERGASGKGTIGTESTGETFIVELAGTLLPCGMPALELLARFSWSEIEAISDAVQFMGREGWYWPLIKAKQDSETSRKRRSSTSSR